MLARPRIEWAPWWSVALLICLTEALYLQPAVLERGLFGADYSELHSRHIAFARDALFGPQHSLPGWYPRELLGAPFAANLQSFPWIPTRLALLVVDPKFVYVIAVAVAAALAALFAYLFCRRVGISELGAVAAGWTFASAGFFTSRVTAGHLPLLEAYPALPLLLWLADRAIAPDRTSHRRRDLFVLALAAGCVALAGHPQLPAYSLGAALVYALIRGRGRDRVVSACAIALGVGATLFAWWPMLLLIQRSTRMLPLAPAANDIAMPYGRLLALIWPAHDGWPGLIAGAGQKIFDGYPSAAYFWDTASYIGVLPLLAAALLLFRNIAQKRFPARPFVFLALMGMAALVFSLPLVQPLQQIIHGTFLRSPARLFYLPTFSLAIALGCAVDTVLRSRLAPNWKISILLLCLTAHVVDLGGFARRFIRPADEDKIPAPFEQVLDREIGSARIAAEDPMYRARYDDAGIFDSILLANSYRALTAFACWPPDANEQRLNASEFPLAGLQAAGVGFVITSEERKDVQPVASTDSENLYRVLNPAQRTAFLSEINSVRSGDAVYSRPSSDEIRVEASAPGSGFIRVLESFDPGWSATVDGAPVPVREANGFALEIPISAGRHTIALQYKTPGRRTGILLSLASLGLLAGLVRFGSKK